MIPLFFFRNIVQLAVLWALYTASYFGILRKMGLDTRLALVPLFAEHGMSRKLFPSMRSFYQAVLSAIVFMAAALYVGPKSTLRAVFLLSGILLYWLFLMRLSRRICGAFGKNIAIQILTMFFPLPMLMILGYGKSQFAGFPTFKIDSAPRIVRYLLNAAVLAFTALELLILVAAVGFLSIRENPPALLVQYMTEDAIEGASGVTEQGEIVRREQVMDAQALESALAQRSRDYYYPDHSGDESVVVMEYIVATDLESKYGMASVNLAQIRDATGKGSGLTFVIQNGGAERNFTSGIEDGTYARYTIRDGKIEKVMDLDPSTSMSEGASLADFIGWTKENYPAERYMLVFWDHGGGLTYGYGLDQINDRADGENIMPCAEIVEAVKTSGVKFDLIGFDACLMQDIDLAYCLSPYADYYLASEETESGFGWNYTLGFSELAKDPGLSTEEFGAYMVSSFDPYNKRLREGKEDTSSTLSLLDMTLVGPAHDKLDELLAREKEAIRLDPGNYANISIAATGAYTFQGSDQIDLIDYLMRLGDMDYDDAILTDKERQELLDAVRACIVMRNGNSGSGIGGVSFCFPVKAISDYGQTHVQLDNLGLAVQKSLCDDFFSIMAYQKSRTRGDSFASVLEPDYTTEDWYVKGFEDYDTAEAFIDIPLKDTGAGYQIELPDKAWKNIVDCQTIAYLRTEQGRMYLGSDHIGSLDENGNPMVALDGTWPHIGGELIAYYAEQPRETEEGTVFSGKTRALLNGKTEVELFIECDPVQEGSEQPAEGRVVGYELVNDPFAFTEKGMRSLEAGDKLRFLFDFYDDEGNLVRTDTYGKTVRVMNDKSIAVKDEPLGKGDIQFGGMLTDIYQRTFLTEMLEAQALR